MYDEDEEKPTLDELIEKTRYEAIETARDCLQSGAPQEAMAAVSVAERLTAIMLERT